MSRSEAHAKWSPSYLLLTNWSVISTSAAFIPLLTVWFASWRFCCCCCFKMTHSAGVNPMNVWTVTSFHRLPAASLSCTVQLLPPSSQYSSPAFFLLWGVLYSVHVCWSALGAGWIRRNYVHVSVCFFFLFLRPCEALIKEKVFICFVLEITNGLTKWKKKYFVCIYSTNQSFHYLLQEPLWPRCLSLFDTCVLFVWTSSINVQRVPWLQAPCFP